MKLVVVDDHHKALVAWAQYRDTLKSAPRLLTLDHHTDTSAPFRNHLKGLQGLDEVGIANLQRHLISDIQFHDLASVARAVTRLSHDEHITTAIGADIISSALVVAHNARDTDIEIYRTHKIICRAVDRKPGSNKVLRAECDVVLESSFLDEALKGFSEILSLAQEPDLEQGPYILDIDLDYFNTRKSIDPGDSLRIRSLASGAGLITVATEPEFVRGCSLELGLTSEWLLERLGSLLSFSK